jgi:hypothetical protein
LAGKPVPQPAAWEPEEKAGGAALSRPTDQTSNNPFFLLVFTENRKLETENRIMQPP